MSGEPPDPGSTPPHDGEEKGSAIDDSGQQGRRSASASKHRAAVGESLPAPCYYCLVTVSQRDTPGTPDIIRKSDPPCSEHVGLAYHQSCFLQAAPTTCPCCLLPGEDDEAYASRFALHVCQHIKGGSLEDADAQTAGCKAITLLSIRDRGMREALCEQGAFSILANILSHHLSNPTVVSAGLDAALTLTQLPNAVDCLGEVADYLQLFEVLIYFITDRAVTLKTIACVAALCGNEASRRVLAEHCKVVECVCTVMEYYCPSDDPNIQLCALKALNSLVEGGLASSMINTECLYVVMSVWKFYLLRRPIQVECCRLMRPICLNADIADLLDEHGAVHRTAEAMTVHWDDKTVQLLSCRFLVRMCEMSESCLVTLSRVRMCSLVSKLLKVHGRDDSVTRAGLEALVVLCSGSTRAAMLHRDKCRVLGTLYLLPSVMTSPGFNDHGGQVLCLRATAALIDRCPANASQLLALDIVWAISVILDDSPEDTEVQALGEAILMALQAKRLPASEVRMMQATRRESFGASSTASTINDGTTRMSAIPAGENNGWAGTTEGLNTVTKLGLYGEDPRTQVKTPLIVGSLSSHAPVQRPGPTPFSPAAPSLPSVVGTASTTSFMLTSNMPQQLAPFTGGGGRSPSMTPEGLSHLLSATRLALMGQSNRLPSMSSPMTEPRRLDYIQQQHQQMMMMMMSGTPSLAARRVSNEVSGGYSTGMMMTGMAAVAGHDNMLADTALALPFLGTNARLMAEEPELFSGGGPGVRRLSQMGTNIMYSAEDEALLSAPSRPTSTAILPPLVAIGQPTTSTTKQAHS